MRVSKKPILATELSDTDTSDIDPKPQGDTSMTDPIRHAITALLTISALPLMTGPV